jgi:hypothetical protein
MADQEGYLLITFLRCPRTFDQKVSRLSNSIATRSSFSDAWEWRFDLKVDDEFSCADDYGNWYRSTCLKIETNLAELDIDGNTIPRIKVGFRYLDPNGNKEDPDKRRKWTGWMKFDTEMFLASPNIQPVHALTYQYADVSANMRIYDLDIFDIEDIIYSSH